MSRLQARFAKLKVGDEVEGIVTGVIDFGAFVNVDGIEGLIHISEISWERVDNPRNYVKVGETVKAKIIAIDKDRLSLSLKQMSEDPWLEQVKAFKKGDIVEGKVTRITPFGAFVQLSPSVEALVHDHMRFLRKETADDIRGFTQKKNHGHASRWRADRMTVGGGEVRSGDIG